jgi:hypothetical protein
MNFSEILTFVRQRIKKLPESPFLHTYIYIYNFLPLAQNKMLTQQFRCIIKQQILTYTGHRKEIHVRKINLGPLHLT